MNWPAGPGGGSSGTEFYRTGMGHRFFNATMPELVKQLTRLNDQLERALTVLEQHPTSPDQGIPNDEEE